jgi:peroxidase
LASSVDHDLDLDLESTPAGGAEIDIAVPGGDSVFAAGTVIAVTRDQRSTASNSIINTVAGFWICRSNTAQRSPSAAVCNSDDTLKSSRGAQDLPLVGDALITGDPRVMENPELSALTILCSCANTTTGWACWRAASGLERQMGKAITTVEYQHIVYSEYLPLLIGGAAGEYQGCDPRVNAKVTQEFSTAAFRVGHSQVSGHAGGPGQQRPGHLQPIARSGILQYRGHR